MLQSKKEKNLFTLLYIGYKPLKNLLYCPFSKISDRIYWMARLVFAAPYFGRLRPQQPATSLANEVKTTLSGHWQSAEAKHGYLHKPLTPWDSLFGCRLRTHHELQFDMDKFKNLLLCILGCNCKHFITPSLLVAQEIDNASKSSSRKLLSFFKAQTCHIRLPGQRQNESRLPWSGLTHQAPQIQFLQPR